MRKCFAMKSNLHVNNNRLIANEFLLKLYEVLESDKKKKQRKL